MCFSYKRQQVMFTHRIEGNVFHQNHFVVARFELDFKVMFRVFSQTSEHFGIHARDTFRGSQQTVTLGVFTNSFEDFDDRGSYAFKVDWLISHRTSIAELFGTHDLGTYRHVNSAPTLLVRREHFRTYNYSRDSSS